MPFEQDNERVHRVGNGKVLRPAVWHRQGRHILLGVSHASGDPSRHRDFAVRATFDMVLGGWVTGKTGTGPGGDGVVLEVRYAADPPSTAPCLIAGTDASNAARAFLAQLKDRQA